MDRENFIPQSGSAHVKEGHEESDLSVRGIVTFGVVLALGGLLTFLGVRVMVSDARWVSLTWLEQKVFPDKKTSSDQLTAAQKQLYLEREARAKASATAQNVEGGRKPESYGRGDEEEHLQRTFPTPRLQYDDTREMSVYRESEEEWLASTGKDSNGNIHIPVDQAMNLLVQHGLRPVSGPFVPPTLPSAAPLVPAPAAQQSRR
jgi:hypothetical protein